MAINKYKVKNTNILHNGKVYKIGSVIELEELAAKKLEDFLDFVSKVETKSTTKTNNNKSSNKQTETPAKETTTEETNPTEGEVNGK